MRLIRDGKKEIELICLYTAQRGGGGSHFFFFLSLSSFIFPSYLSNSQWSINDFELRMNSLASSNTQEGGGGGGGVEERERKKTLTKTHQKLSQEKIFWKEDKGNTDIYTGAKVNYTQRTFYTTCQCLYLEHPLCVIYNPPHAAWKQLHTQHILWRSGNKMSENELHFPEKLGTLLVLDLFWQSTTTNCYESNSLRNNTTTQYYFHGEKRVEFKSKSRTVTITPIHGSSDWRNVSNSYQLDLVVCYGGLNNRVRSPARVRQRIPRSAAARSKLEAAVAVAMECRSQSS